VLDTTIHADLHQRLQDRGFLDQDARAVMIALLTTHRPGSDAGLDPKQIQECSALEADAVDKRLTELFNSGWVTHGVDEGTWRLNHSSYFQLTGQTALDTPAAATRSGYAMHDLGRLSPRQELYEQARQTEAYKALRKLFGGWTKFLEGLTGTALRRVVDNKLIDPSDPMNWETADRAAEAVLRRHGFTRVRTSRLATKALRGAVEQQAKQDQEAGLTWDDPASLAASHKQLAAAHATCPLDLDDPGVWEAPHDQRAALGRALKLEEARWDDLSRWALGNADQFDAGEARCWRIGSQSWLELLDEQLGIFDGYVERPVGVFVTPQREGWALSPSLSLDMIRLVNELGGRVDRSLVHAEIPDRAVTELLERMNTNVLHSGDAAMLQSKTQLLAEVNKELTKHGAQIADVSLDDPRDGWGRLALNWGTGNALRLTVRTFNKRDMKTSRLGSAGAVSPSRKEAITTSATMDLGECVEVAAERSLPLLLSTEAAGLLAGRVRIGRMKGRPGQLTITSSDGVSATTRRLVAAQAIPELRRLKEDGAAVTLDAGARQIVRMTLAKPLSDDPILLGRQTEVAALKVVGSGLDASDTGTGKSVTTGRAMFHRAATTPRFRGLMTADGRLMLQWRGELLDGNQLSGMPPLAPNVDVLVIDERTSPASQIRQWDRELGDRPGVALVPDGILDRYPSDLAVISWHVWIADEAVRYVNPATTSHRSALQLRTSAVADAWMLTATPKGKNAGHLDVLVGLAVGDVAMISERLNTRESGDLTSEVGAHRVRVNFGPTMVRITKQDMEAWMPKVRPAEPLIVEADPALGDLLQAIRDGGREAYRKLIAALKQLKAIEEREGKGSELYREAMAAVSRWQAFVLANVNVFVDASVDPETLMHSEAVLAQALVEQGLVQAAMRGGGDGLPTLRGIVAQTLARTADSGEQILVFAERTRCLHQLSRALHERWGVEAPVGDGKVSKTDFEVLKQRFVAGEIPILMLSPVGNSGHNLQTASQIVHYDLPWVQIGLEQRVGRAGRMGSLHSEVQTAIPYIKGGGIEHIVSVLADRSVEHYQLLDSYEGVAASASTVATQLGAITSQVAQSKDDEGFGRTAARMRVAAAVFGAGDIA